MNDTVRRDNPDLDDAWAGVMRPLPKPKRSKASRISTDHARSQAFRVLALIAGYSAPQRAVILKAAQRMNKS